IKRMCRDLNLDIDIKVLPIKRERDGLALSSRNEYLSQKERTAALLLSGALKKARNFIQEGWTDPVKLSEAIEKELQMSPLIEIDYVGVVDLEKLERIEKIDPNNTLIAAAIKVGSTRLIDNFILGEI
ncbi:MAG: pantoate--beta-alanine ligase, partial [Candidatus Aminicenantes bacterium]|nr:pantoate--beta-alanine ligase [Candidatus Aminicenantes bacterium]